MKKRLISLALLLLLIIPLVLSPISALADGSERTTDLVSQNTDLLTGSQWFVLNDIADEVSKRQRCDVAVCIFDATYESDMWEYAERLYTHFQIGYGEDKSGILLLIDIDDMDFAIATGGFGDTAFTFYATEKIIEVLPSAIKRGDYNALAMEYLETCDRNLTLARAGTPVDVFTDPDNPAGKKQLASILNGSTAYIMDGADLLSEGEIATLSEIAEAVSNEHNFPVVIVTTDTMYGMVPALYTESVYDYLGIGIGSDRSGVMLMVNMGERDVVLFTRGFGNTAFTDYGKEKLEERYISNLSAGNYFDSFSAYITGCDEFLTRAEGGDPITDPLDFWIPFLMSFVFPLIFSFWLCNRLKKRMNTANLQRTASPYIVRGSFQLTGSDDEFSHVTESRTKIESSSSSSSGGRSSGGTSVSRSGSSSRSSKF